MKNFSDKLKLVIGNPSRFFDKVRKEDMWPAFSYYAVLLLIPTIIIMILLSAASYSALGFFHTLGVAAGIAAGAVFYTVALAFGFISSAITHLFVYLMGGRKGYTNTYKSVVYGNTPVVLFCWLPLLNMISGIWSYYLTIKGISKLHGMSMQRAFFATILPLIIILAVVAVLLLFVLF